MENVTLVSFRELCPEMVGTRFSTHRLYSYPAQLIPQIPYYFLKEIPKTNGNSTVLDPFCGTGTVLVEAMHSGRASLGVEVNPVTALVAKVKTTPMAVPKLEENLRQITNLYKSIKKIEYQKPSFENLEFWFTEKTINKLQRIKYCIDTLKSEDNDTYDFFKACFASIIKDVSRADPRIYVPVLPRKGLRKRKKDAWTLFRFRAECNIKSMRKFLILAKSKVKNSQVICEDFMKVKRDWEGIDLIITSPPYISAQKYVRSTRLEAYWLGFTKEKQLDTSKRTIGSERITKSDYQKIRHVGINDLDSLVDEIHALDPVRAGIVNKYFHDMRKAIQKMYNVLNSGGKCVIVIGNNTAKGREVKTSEFIKSLSKETGFCVEKIMVDKILSRGLMTKRNRTAGLIENEWIITLRKD